jgi:hypothetical protein
MNKKLSAKAGGRTYVIEPDLPEVGAYLRVFERGKDMADYLQDSVQDCIEFASEEFGIPPDEWSEMR